MAKKSLSFLEQIEEKFSHLLITDDEEHEIDAIHTGSISLDYSTGVGGIPRGRFTEIFGLPSSGKTTLCLSIAKTVLQNEGRVLYVDAENGLDYRFINSILGDYNKESFILLQPEFAEETFMLAEEGIINGGFDLVILDSIAVLASKDEVEKDFEKDSMTVLSRMISKFIKRNTYAIRHSNTAFIFVNQVRDKIGSYVPMLQAPGGYAIKHICSLRIQLTANFSKDDRIMQDEEVIGAYTKFVIVKNKVGKPLKTYSFPLLFGKGIDYLKDLIVFAEILGIVERGGAYYRLGEITLGQGLVNSMEFLENNKDVLDKIEEMVYNKMNKETEDYKKEIKNEKVVTTGESF